MPWLVLADLSQVSGNKALASSWKAAVMTVNPLLGQKTGAQLPLTMGRRLF